MNDQTPVLQRPVRADAIVIGVVVLVTTGGDALIRPGAAPPTLCSGLVFGLVYGVILGWYAVGTALASRLRATFWWWVSAALPFMCMGFLVLGFARWPGAVWSRWCVIGGVVQLVIISWLSVGCLLAVVGWWSYARHRRADTDA